MVKCAVCLKKFKRKTGTFFRVPVDIHRRLLWEKNCQMHLRSKDSICADHFSRDDIICSGKQPRLLPKAIPQLLLSVASSNCAPAVPQILGSELYYDQLNEALFENEEETVEYQNTSADDANSTTNPLSTIIEIKSEDDTHSDCSTTFSSTKSSQTDDPAKGRINCGFINVSKSGPDKYFNLRCFYCDAEYPISFWSEFSDHILYNHSNLEKVYQICDEMTSIKSEHNKNNDINELDASDSETEDKLQPIDFIHLVPNKSNDTNEIPLIGNIDDAILKDSLSKYSVDIDGTVKYEKKYELLNIEHNYSQAHKPANDGRMNNTDDSVDEITIENSPRDIILDFLNNLKGFSSLWLDRKLHPVPYDRELQDLMDVMKIRWNLNLRIDSLRKNWENIKDWFYTMRTAKEMSGENNVQHIFGEYYDICEEFLTFSEANQPKSKCDMCNYAAINASGLQVHKYSKHKVGLPPYRCNKCPKFFMSIDNMLKHLRKHVENKTTGETAPTVKDLKCFECNQNFLCTNEYKLHLDKHPKGDRPFSCDECGNRFRDVTQLNSHKKRHNNSGYQCQFCPAKLSTAFSFKTHTNAHKGIYEYICEWCGRPFVCRNKWWEHVKYAHLGHGLCKICNREYKKSSILHKHLRRMHKPTFGTVEELAKRSRKGGRGRGGQRGGMNLKARKYEYVIDPVTKVCRLKCPKCDKSFPRHRNIIAHAMKIHNFDIRKLPRGKWQKTMKEQLPNNKTASNSNAEEINAEEGNAAAGNIETEYSVEKFENSNSNSNEFIDENINTSKPVCVVMEVNGRASQAQLLSQLFSDHFEDEPLSNPDPANNWEFTSNC